MDKKYQIIYADPPWSYKTYTKGSGNGNVLNHYETMTETDINNLKVKIIKDEGSNKYSLYVTWETKKVYISENKYTLVPIK
jgi:N6-adenosine-specific RNA methylase IME4